MGVKILESGPGILPQIDKIAGLVNGSKLPGLGIRVGGKETILRIFTIQRTENITRADAKFVDSMR